MILFGHVVHLLGTTTQPCASTCKLKVDSAMPYFRAQEAPGYSYILVVHLPTLVNLCYTVFSVSFVFYFFFTSMLCCLKDKLA